MNPNEDKGSNPQRMGFDHVGNAWRLVAHSAAGNVPPRHGPQLDERQQTPAPVSPPRVMDPSASTNRTLIIVAAIGAGSAVVVALISLVGVLLSK